MTLLSCQMEIRKINSAQVKEVVQKEMERDLGKIIKRRSVEASAKLC